ncbi:2-keto-4-pentenoate hydratase [soil metagenome]
MTAEPIRDSGAAATAQAFVSARLAARATPEYPGVLPVTMADGYVIQEIAIGLYPDEIIGWKVGGVPPPRQAELGIHRLAGPIFARNRFTVDGDITVQAIEGGFCAVEAEFIARIGAGVDPAKTDWTVEEATAAIDAVFIGIEIAGSPLSAINDLGPPIVASDFGNNAGLFVGLELADWRDGLDAIEVETTIDGVSVGTGGAPSLQGGAMESVRFLLEHCARRGRPLTEGTLVSTGAVTGVHRIHAGSDFTCDFRGVGVIKGVTVPATA